MSTQVSSAYNILKSREETWHKIKSRRPRIDPCGTPHFIIYVSDTSSNVSNYDLPVK